MSRPEPPRAGRDAVYAAYSDEIEDFYEQGREAALDGSLHPRGSELLFEIAEELGVTVQ